MRIRKSAGVSHTRDFARRFPESRLIVLASQAERGSALVRYGIRGPPMNHLLEQQGFAVVPHVPTTSEREQLIESLLVRPLLLNASSRSQSNRHRRVLHIEHAAFPLPEPLEWHEAA